MLNCKLLQFSLWTLAFGFSVATCSRELKHHLWKTDQWEARRFWAKQADGFGSVHARMQHFGFIRELSGDVVICTRLPCVCGGWIIDGRVENTISKRCLCRPVTCDSFMFKDGFIREPPARCQVCSRHTFERFLWCEGSVWALLWWEENAGTRLSPAIHYRDFSFEPSENRRLVCHHLGSYLMKNVILLKPLWDSLGEPSWKKFPQMKSSLCPPYVLLTWTVCAIFKDSEVLLLFCLRNWLKCKLIFTSNLSILGMFQRVQG